MNGSSIWTGLPSGCINRMYRTGDLVAAKRELQGCQLWIARTLIGMVESVLGRVREAEISFATAELESRVGQLADPAEKMRRVLHRMVRTEHKIIHRVAPPPPETPIDNRIALVERSAGEARALQSQRIGLDAALFLYSGRFLRALEWYEAAIQYGTGGHGVRALWHLGLGACLWEIGRKRSALRNLETAGLHTMADGRALAVAKNSARLSAVYHAIGHEGSAAAWAQHVEQSACPRETIDALERRADALLFQAKARGHLVVS